jgi:CrcB protein
MQSIIYVFIGGGIGSVLRYLIGLKLNQGNIPFGTLFVNIFGSLLIGLVMGYHLKSLNNSLTENQIIFIIIGVFGGFTTFSSFMYENYLLLINEQYLKFITYTMISLLIGFTAVFLGFLIGKQV